MSQSPYQPPDSQSQMNFDYYQPYGDVMAPARRAGLLLFLLGGLTLIGSMMCAGAGAMFDRLVEQQPEMWQEMQRIPNATPEFLRMVLFVMAGVTLVVAAVQVILGLYVRRGSKAAIATSMVLSILVLLWLLLNAVTSMRTGMAGAAAGMSMCLVGIPLSLYLLLLFWLAGALKSAGAVRAMQDQYAAQYWQYAYQQQMYGQQQQGMQQPGSMPPPMPPPMPPSMPPSMPPPGDADDPRQG